MMQLLKRLISPFARSVRNYPSVNTIDRAVSERKTVLDLFRLDLANLPLQDFAEGKMEINPNGEVIQNYYKILDYKECGIFDTVQVKLTGNNSINVVFRCSEPSMIDDDKLRMVINNLCDIYGQDASARGPLAASESANPDQQFYVMFGRNWMDYPRYKYPVSVRRYSEDVFISVWGFRIKEMVTG